MTVEIDLDVDLSLLEEFIESCEQANGVLTYSAPYALYVEVDTTYSSPPPFEPIYEWVQRNIDVSDDETEEQVTYKILKKIEEEGISGVYFLTREKNKMKDNWEDIAEKYKSNNEKEIVQAPEEIVEEMLSVMLEQSQETIREESYDTGELEKSGAYIMGVNTKTNTITTDNINV